MKIMDLSGNRLVYERDGDTLTGADLSGVMLSGADLIGMDMSGADLRQTDFHRSDLTCAKLVRADLRCANFNRARLDRADLTGADLRDVNFELAQLHETKLDAVQISYDAWPVIAELLRRSAGGDVEKLKLAGFVAIRPPESWGWGMFLQAAGDLADWAVSVIIQFVHPAVQPPDTLRQLLSRRRGQQLAESVFAAIVRESPVGERPKLGKAKPGVTKPEEPESDG